MLPSGEVVELGLTRHLAPGPCSSPLTLGPAASHPNCSVKPQLTRSQGISVLISLDEFLPDESCNGNSKWGAGVELAI